MQSVVVNDFFRRLDPVLEFALRFTLVALLQLAFRNFFFCQAAIIFNAGGVNTTAQSQVAGITIRQAKDVQVFSWRFRQEKVGITLHFFQFIGWLQEAINTALVVIHQIRIIAGKFCRTCFDGLNACHHSLVQVVTFFVSIAWGIVDNAIDDAGFF